MAMIKVIIFYDEEGWAWWYRAHNIKKHISPEFEIDIARIGSPFDHNSYDLIVLFESYLYEQILHVPSEKILVGSSTLKSLPSAFEIYNKFYFAGFLVNNHEAYSLLSSLPNIYCCQNGVDGELFSYKYPRAIEITACWVGNNISMNNKGLNIIREACDISGVSLIALDQSENVYINKVLSQGQVRDEVYHQASCYLCASEMEGTPNPALEALACGLPVISTRVGNMPELIQDGFNGFLVERDAFSFVKALEKLKRSDLKQMSLNARNSILNGWTWKQQVHKYESMFIDLFKKIKNNQFPQVSIIVPTYNRPDMLRETIQSILDQTYQNFEIIVVNDAGQDVSNVVASFNSSKITHLTHTQNKGLAASRNTGIRAAQGKYIAYLDDDDIYYPNHLETLVSHLESTDCHIAYTDSYQANQKLIDDSYQTVSRTLQYSQDFDYELILVQNFVPVLCFMHNRAIIEKIGYFDETLRSHEDWDLWVRVSREYRLDHLAIITSEYRWRDDGSTMTSSKASDYYNTAKAIYHKIRMSVAVSQETIQKQEASLMGRRYELYQMRLNILCSIIVPVYNKLELTQKCLETLFAHTSERMFELVIIDNASSDGTGEYLKNLGYGKFKLISNQYNVGYTIACNQGAKVATGKYLVFLNNDTEPKDGWLDHLVATAEQDLLIGAVGSKLIYPDGKLQEAGAIINKDGSNDSIGNGGDPNGPKYNVYKDVDYCTGASLLVRHDLFKEAGGLDERYAPAYYEDPDLCFSIRELGYRIIYCPESEVIHHESATAGTDKITGIKKFYWINRVKFCEKWRNILEAKPNRPDSARSLEKPVTRPVTVIDGIFYQLASTGIARLWTSLLTEWSKLDFSPTVILLDRAGTAPKIDGIRSRTIPPYDYEAPENDRAFLQALCDEEGANLFVSTYYTTPITTPSVFFAYDMIPENTRLYNLQDPVWQVKHFGITHAKAFIAISINTGRDLIEFYPPAANKVSIAYPGIDTKQFYPSYEQDVELFRQKYSLTKPYYLFVGNRHDHKNGRLLFEGLACVANRAECSIVCVGARYKLDMELIRLVPDVSVKILPLPDDELRAAYSGAIALVYPSIYEGFGLPILEAMACDCPVITCHNTSLPEVAGAAALYVAQDRPEEMAVALQNIQQMDVRTQLIKMGRRQIQKFSWENMAVKVQQALTKTYREVV